MTAQSRGIAHVSPTLVVMFISKLRGIVVFLFTLWGAFVMVPNCWELNWKFGFTVAFIVPCGLWLSYDSFFNADDPSNEF